MNLHYICRTHATRICADESLAYSLWCNAMHRGTEHYAHCNWPSSECQLGCAFEIAALRVVQQHNTVFSKDQLWKPFALLFEVFCGIRASDKAAVLIDQIANLSELRLVNLSPHEQYHLRHCAHRLRSGEIASGVAEQQRSEPSHSRYTRSSSRANLH